MTSKIRATVLSVLLLSLLCGSAPAAESGKPIDGLQVDDAVILTYRDGKDQKQVKIPVALATKGLWGPLPQNNPMAEYFWKKYEKAGFAKAAERYGGNTTQMQQFLSPFMRLTALQAAGAPVEIKVLAPKGEDIKMPLVGKGGKAGQRYYRFWNRRLELRTLSGYGDSFILCDGKNKAGCMLDRKGMTMSWNPTQVKDRFYAPEVLELVLAYNVASGVIMEGKKYGSEQKGVARARIAWLALPACGQEWADDEIVNCPCPPGPKIEWQIQTHGPVSLAIPSNWTSNMAPDGISCKYQFGQGRTPLAGVAVVRMPGAEQMLKGLSDVKVSTTEICGLTAKVHIGNAQKGAVGKLIIFDKPLSDGKPLALALASSQPAKYMPLLDAVLSSIKIGQGEASAPSVPAAEKAASASELGSGTINYTPADNALPEGSTASAPATVSTAPPAATSAPTAAPPTSAATPQADTGKSSARLVRLKGFSDFTGRSEAPKGDGSPDAYIKLKIDAPGQSLLGLSLREAGGGKVIWDTTAGNGVWLIVAAKGGKVLNAADGSLSYQLGQGVEALDLWLQDDHTLERGQKRLELVAELSGGAPLVLPLVDEVKR